MARPFIQVQNGEKNKATRTKPEDGIAFDLHGGALIVERKPLFVLPSKIKRKRRIRY